VRTGMTKVITEAFEANERLTPEVKQNCPTKQPPRPKATSSNNRRPKLLRSLAGCLAFAPRLEKRSKPRKTVAIAMGKSVTVTEPSLRVAILAPVYWKAHIILTRTNSTKYREEPALRPATLPFISISFVVR